MKKLYESITAKIVADLEKGVRPWAKSWNADHSISRPLRANGEAYRGINTLLLWAAAAERGFIAPVWMTYRQATALGGHVRKGEKGSTVVYSNVLVVKEAAESGEEIKRKIPFLKSYTVFNIEQIDDLPGGILPARDLPLNPEARIAHAEAFFAATGADIRHGGDRAFYSPKADFVQMPPFEAFHGAEAYYAVLAHEATHWTGGRGRLGRSFEGNRFGNASYAMEELVAEIGAAFICADLGLSPEPRADHAAYVGAWLKVLKNDTRAIFTAASQAQRAADYLIAYKQTEIKAQKVRSLAY